MTKNNMQKGSIGNLFVYGVLVILIVLGMTAVGGLPKLANPDSEQQVTIITPKQDSSKSTLQLKTFGYITNTPTPKPKN